MGFLDWNKKNTKHNDIGPNIRADGDEAVLAGEEGGMLLLPRHTSNRGSIAFLRSSDI